MGATEISRLTGLGLVQVENLLYRYGRAGLAVLERKVEPSVRQGSAPLTGSFENDKELLTPECLRKWAHLTLRQRVAKVNRKYRVQWSYNTLRSFYFRHKIGYRRTYCTYRESYYARPALVTRRLQFAEEL